jgi:hypothetical protein
MINVMVNPALDWLIIKRKLKRRFKRLTNASIDAMKMDLKFLTPTLQKVYGYGKDKAETEYLNFKMTLSGIQPQTVTGAVSSLDSIAYVKIKDPTRGFSKVVEIKRTKPDLIA